MSMYVELLSKAVDDGLEEFTGEALVGYVLACRAEMLATGPYWGASAYDALAAEVAYDRALLKLCSTSGIEVEAADFTHPSEERRYLETELAGGGINLRSLARQTRTR
jgi:hypothetical protein